MIIGRFVLLHSETRIKAWSIFGYVGFILFIAIFISSICKFAYDDLFDKQTPNGISVSNNIDFMI